jgi:hypothetical protein
MIQRFLFDGVHAKAAGTAIGGQDDLLLVTGAHKTKALLTLVEFAGAWADVALDAPVVQLMPVFSREKGLVDSGIHDSLLSAADDEYSLTLSAD